MAKSKKPVTESPAEILEEWVGFNKFLPRMTEDQLAKVLDYELEHEKRPTYVDRIHTRLTRRRFERERSELLKRLAK